VRRKMKNSKAGFVLMVCLVAVTLSGCLAVAGGPKWPKSECIYPANAEQRAGIEQLVATYVQNVDWGPGSSQPNQYGIPSGIRAPEAIGNLFTPTGVFNIYYYNAGNPIPLYWNPASGPSYNTCNNVGPAQVTAFFGGPGLFPRTITNGHHVITNIQIEVDRSGVTGVVRGTMNITIGTATGSPPNGGTISFWVTGRYWGRARLTSDGWKFDEWDPIVDEPVVIPGCFANNQNP
jgi:hypothetical protein